MKFLKRAACIAAAAAIAVSTICVSADAVGASIMNESTILPAAENPLYTVSMSANPTSPTQNTEFDLKVNVAPMNGVTIKEIAFDITFSTAYFTYLSGAANVGQIDTASGGNGTIKYSYSADNPSIVGTEELVTLKFKANLQGGRIDFGNRNVKNSEDNLIEGEWREFTIEGACIHSNYSTIDKVIKAPTCEEDGITGIYCTNCNTKLGERPPVTKLGHLWDATKATYTTLPSCTRNGIVSMPCKREGCKKTQTENVPALGHDWGPWELTIAATTNKKGQETRICKRCNEKETRDSTSTGPVVTTTAASTTGPQVSILPTVLIDNQTGVRLDFSAGSVASDTVLTVKTLAQTSKVLTYDITLMKGNQAVQPSGTLYVTIDLPTSMKADNFYVYRDNNDGTYTDMFATYVNGKDLNRVSFSTGHLSEYLVTSEKRSDVVNAPATTTATTSAPTAPPVTTTPFTSPEPMTVTTPVIENNGTPSVSDSTQNNSKAPDVIIGTGGNTGNTDGTGSNKTDPQNPSTGILALSIPLLAAAVGIFVAKKR